MLNQDSSNKNAPLAGLRVLDIATFIAAPFCGVILADFGAEVLADDYNTQLELLLWTAVSVKL